MTDVVSPCNSSGSVLCSPIACDVRAISSHDNVKPANYLTELVPRCSLIVGVYEPTGAAPCEHDEHGAILDCMEARDAAGAVANMDAHPRATGSR